MSRLTLIKQSTMTRKPNAIQQMIKIHPIRFISTVAISIGIVHSAYSVQIELDDARPYGNIGQPAVYPSNLVEKGGIIYETRFEPDEYTGDVVARRITNVVARRITNVVARRITNNGTICQDDIDDDDFVTGTRNDTTAADNTCPTGGDNTIWRAHEQLPDHDQRLIFTPGGSFIWGELDEDLKTKLDIEGDIVLDGEEDSHGVKLVNWIRGSEVDEGTDPGNFRSRMKLNHKGEQVHYPLGDFVHSSVQYVGPPSNLNADPDYLSFIIDNKTRKSIVYVGGNDGMLHAFDAETGEEIFAFIPEGVFPKLEYLSDQGYAQEYYVDGTPTIKDAKANFSSCSELDANLECWRTVLVGGLNSGGQTIYALDVTDPEPSNASQAVSDMFLWEFTHEDLGYSYSRPQIGKLHDGRWVAVFGNGIHDTKTVKASLFIVDISDGSLIQKLDIDSVSETNGLLSPTLIDSDYDGDIDDIFAGDTDGNLWKIDFTTVNNGGDFEATVAYGDGTDDEPLTRVTGIDSEGNKTNLIIQTVPIVTKTSNGEVIVIFGTGRIFGETDTTYNYGDNLFGILDNADPDTGHGVYPDDFELTTYSNSVTSEGSNTRKLLLDTTANDNVGWRLKLDSGERILTDLILSDKRISFTSINPTAEITQNWLNGVNYETGGTPPLFLDINDDGEIDEDDLENGIPTSINLGPGIVSGPRVANIKGGYDVNLVTNGLRRSDTYEPPFYDPGLVGGHFDLDTFDAYGVDDCWNDKCHTHEYDDDWDVTGVNMLVSGGIALPADSQDRKLGTGILSSKHRGLKEAMLLEQDNPDDYDDSLSTEVYINIVNPFSVDTDEFAQARANRGIDDNVVAPPATIFFHCIGGSYYELPAPEFNNLDQLDRTCVVNDITTLMINFEDINTLRATEPKCVKKNEQGPPSTTGNTSYRDGAIVVQVVRTSDDVVIYENANYEHLKKDSLIKADIPKDLSDKVQCGQVNESLRAYKDPEQFGGEEYVHPDDVGDDDDNDDDSQNNGDGTQVNPDGKRLTSGSTVSASNVSSTRVSWREILER